MSIDFILKTIYAYYPQNLKYESNDYQSSIEHKNYLSAIKKVNDDLFFLIQNLFPKKVENFSSVEYPCYEYIVQLNNSEQESFIKKQELYLFVSKLCNYYYFYLLETVVEKDEEVYTILEDYSNFRHSIKTLQDSLNKEGYIMIPKQIVIKKVEHVETELQSEPTVFHLLFSDLYNHYC